MYRLLSSFFSSFFASLLAAWLLLTTSTLHTAAHAATPDQLLNEYRAQTGQAPNAAKGEAFFKADHGEKWRCTSCHTSNPASTGRHASTDKTIEPLAPSANSKRFTDSAKVEKWFRRNCKDVLARECSAIEKADVLAWLITVR